MTLDLGWLTAGRGPGSLGMFEGVLAAIDDGSLDARIAFLFMHRERGEGEASDAFMDLAASRGIPIESLSSARFREEHGGDFATHREEYDARWPACDAEVLGDTNLDGFFDALDIETFLDLLFP